MQERPTAQSRRAIGFSLLVNQKRKTDARLSAKSLRVPQIAQPDGRQPRSLVQKGLRVTAPLRDMLPAENSPVVPKKCNDRRPVLPQRAQANPPPFRIWQNNPRQLRTQTHTRIHRQ